MGPKELINSPIASLRVFSHHLWSTHLSCSTSTTNTSGTTFGTCLSLPPFCSTSVEVLEGNQGSASQQRLGYSCLPVPYLSGTWSLRDKFSFFFCFWVLGWLSWLQWGRQRVWRWIPTGDFCSIALWWRGCSLLSGLDTFGMTRFCERSTLDFCMFPNRGPMRHCIYSNTE